MENFVEKIKQFIRWLKSNSGITAMLMFCFPLGLYLKKKYGNSKGISKKFVISTSALYILFALYNYANHKNELFLMEKDYQAQVSELETENETLSKNYEDVNVSFMSYQEEMEPFEQLNDLEKEKKLKESEKMTAYIDTLDDLPNINELTFKDQGKVDSLKEKFELLSDSQKKEISDSEVKTYIDKVKSLVEKENKRVAVEKEAADKKADEEKAAAEKKVAAEKAAAAKKAEEERRGYETGITFDNLSRDPDSYIYKKVKFYGKVIQVMEGDGETQIRLAVNDDYDQVIYAAYESGLVTSRVLEDDYITILGVSDGLLTYESTMGGEITIPSVIVDKINQ